MGTALQLKALADAGQIERSITLGEELFERLAPSSGPAVPIAAAALQSACMSVMHVGRSTEL